MMVDLSMEEIRIAWIALRKAARTSHPIIAAAEREIAYKLANLLPPQFTKDETDA
jgi:hypothetical protein